MRSFLSSEIEESRSCRVNESAREKKRERIGERERVIFVHLKIQSSQTHTLLPKIHTHTHGKNMFKKLCSSIATPPTTTKSSGGGGGAVSSQNLTRESTKKPPLLKAEDVEETRSKVFPVFDPNPNNVSIHPKTPIRNFELGPIIGTGSFGIVPIAKHRDSGLVVAIKILSKAHVAKTKQIVHIVQEKKILERCSKSEFIVRLFSYAQTREEIHLVMEFVPGGELFNQLRIYRRLKNGIARFYVVEIALAFEYLHETCAKPCRVAYRDLKPENVLLDGYGYVKLADFGFAKQLGPKSIGKRKDGGGGGGSGGCDGAMEELRQKVGFIENEKAYTLCGTPDYLAPEVILNGGHDESVDWWALGVLLYELVRGIPPFQSEEPWATYQKILKREFTFRPKEPKKAKKTKHKSGKKETSTTTTSGSKKKKVKTDEGNGKQNDKEGEDEEEEEEEEEEETENAFGFTKESRDLIRKLLTVESANRLGSTYGSIEIKNHPWFRSVDWKLASERKWRKPPIVPQCPRSEKELYAMLQKIAEEEGFDEESSARNDTNFVELSQEDEAAFQALEDDCEGANDKNENEIDNIITVET